MGTAAHVTHWMPSVRDEKQVGRDRVSMASGAHVRGPVGVGAGPVPADDLDYSDECGAKPAQIQIAAEPPSRLSFAQRPNGVWVDAGTRERCPGSPTGSRSPHGADVQRGRCPVAWVAAADRRAVARVGPLARGMAGGPVGRAGR